MHAQSLQDAETLKMADGWIFLELSFIDDFGELVFFRRINGKNQIIIDNSEFDSGDWWDESEMSDDELVGDLEDAVLVPFMRIPKAHFHS